MASLEMYPTVYYNMCKLLFKVMPCSIVYSDTIGNNKERTNKLCITQQNSIRQSVRGRPIWADLYLLIWADFQVKKHVQDAPACVKYKRIYLLVCS